MASSDLSPGARIAIGVAIAIAGLAAFAMGCVTAWHRVPFSDDHWLGLPLGMAFVAFGALLAMPADMSRVRGILAAIVVTGFALMFDWIAFGPGERHFTASASSHGAGVRTPVSSTTGRIAFGIVALMMAAGAAWLWVAALRRRGITISD